MAGVITYVKESFEELKNNVTWTPWSEAQRLTVVVAVFSILFSLAIWGIDTVFSKVISQYFSNNSKYPDSLNIYSNGLTKRKQIINHFSNISNS